MRGDTLTTREVFDRLIEALHLGQPYNVYIVVSEEDRLRCVRRFEERRRTSCLDGMPWRKQACNAYDIDGSHLVFATIDEYASFAMANQNHPYAEFWDPRAYIEGERRIEAALRARGEIA